jgi:hypothetical protein
MNNSNVFEELSVSTVDLTVAIISVLLAPLHVASKTTFATVQTTIDTSPQLTPTTLQIHYCYSYSYEILPTCTHQFENIQINDEIYALFKFLQLKNSNVVV